MGIKNKKIDTIKKLRNDICQNIRGINKYITKKKMDELETYRLLSFCHPIEREQFIIRFNNLKEKEV